MTAADIIYAIAFYTIAAVCVASALVVVMHKNPVMSALYLVVCFFGLASAYVMLQAHFLAAVQVLLYAGAVLVLFVMIIMLLDLRPQDLGLAKPSVGKGIGVAAAFSLVAMTATVVLGLSGSIVPDRNRPASDRPDEVAQVLIQLGEDPSIITGRFIPDLKQPTDRSLVVASGKIVSELHKPEVLEIALNFQRPDKNGAMVFLFPKVIAEMPRGRMEKAFEDLGQGLRSNATADFAHYRVPDSYPEVQKEDVIDLVRVAAYARLQYLTEFGSTAEVGRKMFWTYYLPFEAAGVLLLAAVLGVMVLVRRAPEEAEK